MKHGKSQRVQFFELLSAPILVLDPKCVIVDANSAFSAWADLPNRCIIGKPCYRLALGENTPCWKYDDANCPVQLVLERAQPVRSLHEKQFGGRATIEEVVATPVFGDDREIDYIILELSDISELLKTKEIVTYLKKEINNLKGIIPICSTCKKVRNDDGFWQNLDQFISSHADVRFSHSICPECIKSNHPEICNLSPTLCQDENK